MDSINRQQPEQSHADLRSADAVAKIKEIVKSAETCFFCTAAGADSPSAGTRPMNVRRVDEDGTFWFLSANDSHKNAEIGADPHVQLFLQGSPHSDFLHLVGRARITTDREVIKGLWTPVIRTWFTGGVDDPRITAIAVTPTGGYYWDNKHGDTVAGIKMLIGAAVRKTLDDSIEGKVQV